jgi:4'-phosphopantetheinyl transferase EntD
MSDVDLSDLFPGDAVIVRAAWFDSEPAPLLPDELRCVERAVPQRRREFAAGRDCARRCFAQAGTPPAAPLLPDTDRAPIWPVGWLGSITHTLLNGRLFAATAIAKAGRLLAVGIDAEPCLPVGSDVEASVLTPAETANLASLREQGKKGTGELARAIFSAKEALYKAQPAHSRRMVEFDEVEIEFPEGLPERDQRSLPFRYRRWDGLLGIGRVFCPAGLLITGVQISVPEGNFEVNPW